MKTVTFNLKDSQNDSGMTFVDDEKDYDDDEKSMDSSHQGLTKQEKNVEIQVRRVRQSIDLDFFNEIYSSKYCSH